MSHIPKFSKSFFVVVVAMIEALPRIHIGPCQQLEAEVDAFTHAVVAVNGRIPVAVTSVLPEGAVLHVDVEDVHDALIIEHFAEVAEHIRGALRGTEDARVAVVCAQGVSRSATLVLAYMMQYGVAGEPSDRPQSMSSVLDYLEALREVYPEACPNDGFLQQLDVWRAMDFKHDMSNGVYRSLRARQLARDVQELGQEVDTARLGQPGGVENDERGKDGQSGGDHAVASVSYRCRSCRQMLATSQNVMVDVSLGGEGFTWRKLKKNMAQSASSSAGSSIFVEPMQWMNGINDEAQGKLYCPNVSCKARLGSFNWSGMQNESSQWITPAFQLHLSRLDAIDTCATVAEAAVVDIRKPKLSQKCSLQGAEPQGTEPPSSRLSCLIFDCDGVLVDSERASCEALRRSILEVTQFDIPHAFPEDFVPVFGMDVLSCLEYYVEAHQQHDAFERAAGLSTRPDADADDPTTNHWMAALAAKVAAAKGPHYEAITKAGIGALLCCSPLTRSTCLCERTLLRHFYSPASPVPVQSLDFPPDPIQGAANLMREACSVLPTAIASSGSHAKIRHNLSSAGLWGIVPVEAIVSAQDVPRGKPAPDVYLKALEVVGCQDAAKDALVIEDSIHGIHAAIRAGIGHVAAITTSLNEEQMMNSLKRLRESFAADCGGSSQADGPDGTDRTDRADRTDRTDRVEEVWIGATRIFLVRTLPRLDVLSEVASRVCSRASDRIS